MSYTLLRYFSTSILVTEHTMSMVLQMGLAFTGILVPYLQAELRKGRRKRPLGKGCRYFSTLLHHLSRPFLSVPAFMWNGVLKPRRTLQGDAETDSDDNGRYCAFASPAWLPQLFRSVCQHHHDHARLHRRSGNRRRPG